MFLAYSSLVEGASNSNSDRLACYPHTTARKTLPRQRRCVPVVSTRGPQEKVKTKHGTSLAIAIDQENYFCAYKIFLNALFRYASIAFIKLIFMFL